MIPAPPSQSELPPEVVRVTGTNRGTYFGGAVALDFMFWPWGRHVGLWVEPEYDLTYQHGASSGMGTTGGVLFGWQRRLKTELPW